MTDHPSTEVVTFQDAIDRQNYLQTHVFGTGTSPKDFSTEGKIEFIKTNVIALTDEIHEALGEVGWKPWASSRHITREAYLDELADAFHFFMNMLIVVDEDAMSFFARYQRKTQKNIKRQEEGYDGIAGKCPMCKRALDDAAVTCEVLYAADDKTRPVGGFCAERSGEWTAGR